MNRYFIKRIAVSAIACIITGIAGLASAAQIKAPPRPIASERIVIKPGATVESAKLHKHKMRRIKEKITDKRKP